MDNHLASRRKTIGMLGAGALLSMGLWPGCATPRRAASSKPFRFLVVNDTHYMSPDCGTWLEGVVNKMKTYPEAEFCLMVGDLVEKGERAHLGAVADIFSRLPIPIYTQIGNHDYLTQTDRSSYEAVFPKRVNYWFEHRGWQFVGFDSTEGLKYERTLIQPATLRALGEIRSKLDNAKPTAFFTHFPLGAGVTYRPDNADAALDFFREYNVRAIFNGHFHGYTERTWNFAAITTNKCCALKRANHDRTKEKGFFLCTARDGEIVREFIQVTPLPPPPA